jgi:hypothetical protein
MYLHTLPLATPRYEATLSLRDSFSVIGGISDSGVLVIPTAAQDERYTVSGGILGLPYLAYLGQAGAPPLKFTFGLPVVALVVATESTIAPIAVAVIEPGLVSAERRGQYGNDLLFFLGFSDGSNVTVAGPNMPFTEAGAPVYLGRPMSFFIDAGYSIYSAV